MANNRIQKHRKKQQEEISKIPPNVAQVIKDLPKEKRQVIIQELSVRHSGPLPDGETIRIYNEVIPDGGNRLMTNVEKQLDHRIEIENNGVKRSFNQSSTGQWMAFCIAILFGLIAWDLAKSGQTMVASILGTVDLVALVAVFITGRVTKR